MPDRLGADHGGVHDADDADDLRFEKVLQRPHGRAGKPDAIGERLEGGPAIPLELADEHGVDRIQHGSPPRLLMNRFVGN